MTPKEISANIEIEIDFYKSEIISNLKYLSPYDRYVNENIEFVNNNPEKEAEFFEDAYNSFHSYFPYLINNSLLVAFDSYIEYKLKLIFGEFHAKEYEKSSDESSIKYYNNSILQKFGFDLSDVKKDWEIIDDLHSIRNKIVHRNSSLSESFQPSISEIKKVMKSDFYSLLMKYKDFIIYNELTTRFYIDDTKLLLRYLNSISNYLIYILRKIKAPLARV